MLLGTFGAVVLPVGIPITSVSSRRLFCFSLYCFLCAGAETACICAVSYLCNIFEYLFQNNN